MNAEGTSGVRDMEVSPPWSGYIFNGMKRVEMRKNKPDGWGSVRTGLNIRISEKGSTRSAHFKVVDTRTYDDLRKCFVAEGVRNLLPGKKTLQEGHDIYLGFDGSSNSARFKREQEFNEFGCIVIELEPVDDFHQREDSSISESLKAHVEGSSRPKGDPNCRHVYDTGSSSCINNDDTMGGCGSSWEKMC